VTVEVPHREFFANDPFIVVQLWHYIIDPTKFIICLPLFVSTSFFKFLVVVDSIWLEKLFIFLERRKVFGVTMAT